ncbi:putative DNA topoisomerase II [Trypanosoma rangeli]|uniref:carboxypeptidase Taq n=1 Tax=Trypanosoma rangeli TaxID=5698 RepID=A0A422P4R1_TRYRA|nr:putative DNA topoisomerase II [Trypanosoma rangeli]RNF12675.1 putative DNA topoisomerase II [Trypanosoma rangeli]|eukprot:RNF12675.1 putative DNA topoisomerase II [Trypanosoma rangeli]
MEAYSKLEKIFTKIYRFRHLCSLAFWDIQVIMPPGGAEARGAALGELELYIHGLLTDPATGALLEEAEKAQQQLGTLQRANIREMRLQWERENLLPEDLLRKKSELTTKAQYIWRKSRETNDYGLWLPVFKELVTLFREMGAALAGDSGKHPYEALFHLFEPGMPLQRVDDIFNDVKSWLPALIHEVQEKQKASVEVLEPVGPFPLEAQRELSRYCMNVWKFDFDAGRQDISAHPFCGNVKEDVRITTKYNEQRFEEGLMGVLHETGHAKYEQNCGPKEMATQPVATSRSLGVHEGQSLFSERMIGRSQPFLEFILPKLKELFGDQPAFTVRNMTRYMRRVKPGFIRIRSDEVCYTMHVILRYEIERDLIEGKLRVEDVPTVWNEKMKSYLGVETLGNDRDGCLQDIHWAIGSMGYFPTYSLGAMVAAQLMASIRRDLGEDVVDDCIRKGELRPILEKQREKIWQHGSIFTTEELLTQATGEPLNPAYFRKHLERYLLEGAD